MTLTTREYWFQLVDNLTVRALVGTNNLHFSPTVAGGVQSGGFDWAGVSNRRSRSRKQLEASSPTETPDPSTTFLLILSSTSFFLFVPPLHHYPQLNLLICVSLPPQATKTISPTRRDGGDLVPSAQTHQQEPSSILFGSRSVAAEVELAEHNRHDEGFSTAGLVAQRQCPHLLSTL